jgi:TatD DNase family protein
VPLDKLLLETDAPYLTPAPFRGRINESMYVESIAKFLSDLRGEPLDKIARATTDNASKLFKI